MDQHGRAINHQPFMKIKTNAYGPDVHSDQYGRAIRVYDTGNGLVAR